MTDATTPPKKLGSRIWSALTGAARKPGARGIVRAFTRLHTWVYRVSGGRASAPRFPTCLLTVRGRKSGTPRTAPLVYVMDGDDFVVAAAYSGADTHPTWWLNLVAAGEGTVEVRDRTVPVTLVEATGEDRERLWRKLVAMYPPFREYQTRTDRVIPVARLRPAAAA